jgi:pyrroline-5-carboxylate reductase
VTRIVLTGLRTAGVELRDAVVSDTNPEVLKRLGETLPGMISAGPDNARAAAQDLVILALHPPALGPVLAEIETAVRPEALVLSMAPKVTLARLSESLGGLRRVARMIPNAPSIIGAGYNPIAFHDGLSLEDRACVVRFFQPLGECPEVAESKLEGFALLTGMGPTYLWFQLQTLRELAAEFGLEDSEIAPALKRMVCGSTRTLLESGLSSTEVMDLVPVKPLADYEAATGEAYRTRLPGLFAKIKP